MQAQLGFSVFGDDRDWSASGKTGCPRFPLRLTPVGFFAVPSKRGALMGDKGGKKDKTKLQKQVQVKHASQEKKKIDKAPVAKPAKG